MAAFSSIAQVYRLALVVGSLIVGMLGSGVMAQDQRARKLAPRCLQKDDICSEEEQSECLSDGSQLFLSANWERSDDTFNYKLSKEKN